MEKGREVQLPLGGVTVRLAEDFDKSRVSRFLDEVLDDKFDVAAAQKRPQDILAELGIQVSEKDRARLGEMTLDQMLGRGETVAVAPAAAVAVAVVVLCWPTPAY